MELEYHLYPWKTSDAPSWAIKRYNLDNEIVDDYENSLHYSWIKEHDQKIARLQEEMILVMSSIKKIEENQL